MFFYFSSNLAARYLRKIVYLRNISLIILNESSFSVNYNQTIIQIENIKEKRKKFRERFDEVHLTEAHFR